MTETRDDSVTWLTQEAYDRLKAEFAGRSLVWSLHRPRLASAFDRVLVMEHGRLVDQGPPADVEKPGSPLAPLLAAE